MYEKDVFFASPNSSRSLVVGPLFGLRGLRGLWKAAFTRVEEYKKATVVIVGIVVTLVKVVEVVNVMRKENELIFFGIKQFVRWNKKIKMY